MKRFDLEEMRVYTHDDDEPVPPPRECSTASLVWKLTFLVIAFCIIMTVWIANAFAHTAPAGWQYGWDCCSAMDCRDIGQNVKETKEGYIVPSGELIPYRSKQIRDSQDSHFHWCTKGGTDDGKTICLYVPNKGV